TLPLVYFKTDVESGVQEVVSGTYSYDVPRYRFSVAYVDHGRTLRMDYACLLRRNCGSVYGAKFASGGNRAWLHPVDNPRGITDGAEEPFVQVGDAGPRQIASGWSSFWSGTDISIVGWVEDGNYLLYRFKGNTYIHGAREGRTSPLPQLSGSYNWLPMDTGG